MRRFWLALIAVCILSIPFVVTGEETAPVNNPITTPTQTNPQKITKMATGKVVEFTDTTIRIERTVKGNMEVMDLDLENPIKDIKSGDKVRVSYVEKEGKHVVTKITKVTIKQKTPVARKENKAASGQSVVVPKGK